MTSVIQFFFNLPIIKTVSVGRQLKTINFQHYRWVYKNILIGRFHTIQLVFIIRNLMQYFRHRQSHDNLFNGHWIFSWFFFSFFTSKNYANNERKQKYFFIVQNRKLKVSNINIFECQVKVIQIKTDFLHRKIYKIILNKILQQNKYVRA